MDTEGPGSPSQEPKASPGSVQIKPEPQDDGAVITNTNDREVISLISDDEDEAPMLPARRSLGTPFQEPPSKTANVPNLGSSVFSKPKSADNQSQAAKALDMVKLLQRKNQIAKETAERFHIPAQQEEPATAQAFNSDLFITESHPATPDPAETFRSLKRAVDRKRRQGNLSVEEEIEFMRSETDEKVRLLMQRSDANYELSEDHTSKASSEALAVPDLPSKSGRKRKGETNSQPKKKRARKNSGTEDILEVARRKLAAKAEAKSKRATKKPVPKGQKPKYDGPAMNNADSLQGTNIFDDALQNNDLGDQPTYDPTGQKKAALKQMIASFPKDTHDIAQADAKALDKALRSFTGQGSCHSAPDGNWALKGMKVTLRGFQVLGVGFMRRRELSSVAPKGGILADQMGLGKTVCMLANIINGQSLAPKKRRTTLIVASAALVSQWRQEIADKLYTRHEDKKHGIGRVKEYHASAQIKGNEETLEILECDIVLTTYTQVSKSYPEAEIPPELVTAEQKQQWWEKYYEEHKGLLHRVTFHRIVLDEAQAIKNHRSLTSRACSALKGTHRWSISGTPVLNNLNELYGNFKFLQVPHTSSFRIFKENFTSDDDKEGILKLKIVLNTFMIRRTHADTLFHSTLLTLPTPHQDIQWVTFNSVERAVYDIVKARFVNKINCIAQSGQNELDRQYTMIWAMLLRLRQLCSHILLVQGTMIDLLEREDFERLREISSEDLSEESEALLTHLQQKMISNTSVKQHKATDGDTILTETETAPIDQAWSDSADVNLGGRHGLSYDFGRYLKTLQESGAFEAICQRTLCSGCRQPPHDPYVTSCFHIFCFACLSDLQKSFARRGFNFHRCSECGVAYTDAKSCEKVLEPYLDAQENLGGSTQDDGPGIRAKTSSKEKAETANWIEMRGQILPSVKTIALKARVMAWIAEDPDVKIIVFSQFLPMLAILVKVCKTEGWEVEKYTGSISHESREKALGRFGDPKKNVRILLASLKCGGIGLNLTMASRVITLDPWWNASIEQQAFCRVYRIGQTSETKMARLVVRNTIDEAIMALQKSKQISIDAAMENSQRQGQISTKELMRIFGRVGKDKDGKPFIFPQRDDDGGDEGRAPPRPADRESDDDGDGLQNED